MKSKNIATKQKADLKKFVDVAYKNKNLWFSDGMTVFLELSNPEYFGDIMPLLNSILIKYPKIITKEDVNDDFKIKEMRYILQILSEDERMGPYSKRRGLPPETPLFSMVFKTEDKIHEDVLNIENFPELDTQSLLDSLEKILKTLKTDDFETVYWD